MKQPMMTVLLVLALGLGAARANYTFTLNSDTPITIDNVSTFSASSWGALTGSGTPVSVSATLNLTTTDPLFSISDLYANLVHIDSGSSVFSTVLLDGTTPAPVLGALSGYNHIVSFSLPGMMGAGLNGSWGLYLEDTSTGGAVTLNSWNLNVTTTAVPEPDQIIMMLTLAGVGGLGMLWRLRRRNLKY
ncbi:MAG: hypothetical protein WCJ07_09310 [Verrucomicrobiota bacterium]